MTDDRFVGAFDLAGPVAFDGVLDQLAFAGEVITEPWGVNFDPGRCEFLSAGAVRADRLRRDPVRRLDGHRPPIGRLVVDGVSGNSCIGWEVR